MLLAAGDLDPAFGVGGIVTTDLRIPTGDSGKDLIVLQSDGKIVVAGFPALARYNSDGSLDTTFGTEGKVTNAFASRGGSAMTLDAAGDIVVAGTTEGTTTDWDFALARYTSEGILDTTFGVGGKVITDFNTSRDEAFDVAVDAAGNIVVAGRAGNGFALARYVSNGSGSGGKVTTAVGPGGSWAAGVAIDAQGRILVAGSTLVAPGTARIALVRYTSDGSLDPSFGNGGNVISGFGSAYDNVAAVAVDANGMITVAGRADMGHWVEYLPGKTYWDSDEDFLVARFNPNGSPDDGSANDANPADRFGTNGRVTTDFGSKDDHASSLAIDAGGNIVVAGTYAWPGNDFALARYTSQGDLDVSFGSSGKVTTDFEPYTAVASGVALDAAGKIVVAGTTKGVFNVPENFALVRYTTSGSLDADFGDGGKVITDFGRPAPDDEARSVVVAQPDGKILVAGYSNRSLSGSPYYDFALARHNADGTPDITFGQDVDGDGVRDGVVITNISDQYDYAQAIAVQPDGKIVVAGYVRRWSASRWQYDFALARYNADGSLDDGSWSDSTPGDRFGNDGKVITDFGANLND